MNRSEAIMEIMAILNETGLLIPGKRPFRIVTDYIEFKIDRLGPEKALQDVRNTKDHLVAQIEQMMM